MIQLADEGRLLAEPLKSSLQARFHPDGVAGTEALALTAASAAAATVIATVARGSTIRRFIWGLSRAGDGPVRESALRGVVSGIRMFVNGCPDAKRCAPSRSTWSS